MNKEGGAMDLKAGHLIDFPKDIQSQVPEIENRPCQSHFTQEIASQPFANKPHWSLENVGAREEIKSSCYYFSLSNFVSI